MPQLFVCLLYAACLSLSLPGTTLELEESPAAPAGTSCRGCDAVVQRVLPLLPRQPAKVVVVDREQMTVLLKSRLENAEGFITHGDPTVYLTKQGSTFQHALRGPGIWDYALAIIIWHEMAHLEGADEQHARQKEEELWSQFVVAGDVDAGRGMAYLNLLRKRP
jgi:hypothetical protein